MSGGESTFAKVSELGTGLNMNVPNPDHVGASVAVDEASALRLDSGQEDDLLLAALERVHGTDQY